MELPYPEEYLEMLDARALTEDLARDFRKKWAQQVLDANDWGRRAGRSTVITTDLRDNLFEAFSEVPNWGRAIEVGDVDVKDLLETGRLVVEREALREMIETHQSDLVTKVFVDNVQVPTTPESGMVLVE